MLSIPQKSLGLGSEADSPLAGGDGGEGSAMQEMRLNGIHPYPMPPQELSSDGSGTCCINPGICIAR